MSEKTTFDASSCIQIQILAQHLDLPNATQAISALQANILIKFLTIHVLTHLTRKKQSSVIDILIINLTNFQTSL